VREGCLEGREWEGKGEGREKERVDRWRLAERGPREMEGEAESPRRSFARSTEDRKKERE